MWVNVVVGGWKYVIVVCGCVWRLNMMVSAGMYLCGLVCELVSVLIGGVVEYVVLRGCVCGGCMWWLYVVVCSDVILFFSNSQVVSLVVCCVVVGGVVLCVWWCVVCV